MPHLETIGSLDHSFGNGISEHFICPDYMGTHNMNTSSDRARFLEDDILEDPLEDVYGQFSLEKDVVMNIGKEEAKPMPFGIQSHQFEEDLMEEGFKERMKYMTTSDQMLDSCRSKTMGMGFTFIVPINIFSLWDLIDNVFQGATHEQVHMEAASMLGNGNNFSLKEESNVFPFEFHFDSLVGGTKDIMFDKKSSPNDLLGNRSLENIALNDLFFPEHMDIKVSSVLDAKIDIRETFQDLYSEVFYSLCPDLFNETHGMLFSDEIYRDKGVFVRNLLTSFEFSSMDLDSAYLDKEWEIYEMFQNKILYT